MEIVSFAVIKLTLISLLGFYLCKRNLFNDEVLRFLTFFVVNITVPFLIFSHLIKNSQAVLSYNLGIFLVLSLVIFLSGYILSNIFSFRSNHRFKSEFVSLVSFQNSGYLPMNIALFLFTPLIQEQFLIYIFLYLLGFNILMWSAGSFFTFKKRGEKFKFKSIFTPPIVSTIAALFLIYIKIADIIPEIIITPIRMVGEVSYVLSMVILGYWLAKVKLKGLSRNLLSVGGVSLLKLVIMPLLFLIVILKFNIASLLGLFIILEAAMPSAASLPIVAVLRDADSEFISQGVFITHVLSIFTIPLWLGLYLKLSGFPI
ncbi:MAG: AEC family transporter [Candidatus Omnitrophica bacterium]|jgi:predicted permease|nr:AEC family transporter [Candidatus Omnitrophota bacterium]